MDPITIGIVGTAVLGTISTILGHKAKQAEAKANRKAAIQNLGLVYNDLNARLTEERAAAAQSREMIEEEAGTLAGQTVTSAASGNVAGATVDALLGDVARQEGRALSTIDANLGFAESQVRRGQKAAHVQAAQQIAGVKSPSWAALGLNVAGHGLNAYASLRR